MTTTTTATTTTATPRFLAHLTNLRLDRTTRLLAAVIETCLPGAYVATLTEDGPDGRYVATVVLPADFADVSFGAYHTTWRPAAVARFAQAGQRNVRVRAELGLPLATLDDYPPARISAQHPETSAEALAAAGPAADERHPVTSGERQHWIDTGEYPKATTPVGADDL